MEEGGGGELRDVGEEFDYGAREPVALVGGVGAAPVVLHCEGQGWPEVEGVGYCLFEFALAGCWESMLVVCREDWLKKLRTWGRRGSHFSNFF